MDPTLKHPTKHRKGYTLLEVLIAAVILVITLPGLATLVIGSRKTQVSSLRMDQASQIGQQILDSLMLQPATLFTPGNTARTVSGIKYSVAITNTPNNGFTIAVITVSWNQGGKAQQIQTQGVLR